MILGFFVFKDEPSTNSKEDSKCDDWIGAALVIAGLVLVVFVLSDDPSSKVGRTLVSFLRPWFAFSRGLSLT